MIGKLIAIASGVVALIDVVVAVSNGGAISHLSYVVLGLCVLGVAVGAVLSDSNV